MKKFYLAALLCCAYTLHAFSQGCVPVRSTGSGIMERPGYGKRSKTPQWTFSMNNRYFESFRHFVGTEEQKQRAKDGSEVINKSYTLDLNAVRNFPKGWSVSMNVPLVVNDRSSLYEHGGTERHSTQANGLGDVRLTAYKWLLDPKKVKKMNIQAGAGIKLPTGNYRVKDHFYTGANGARILGPVDQSIQLGDGGTAMTAELNSFYNFTRKLNVYANFYYLLNPRETNGVFTARGRMPSATAIAYGSDVMSVPDQYMARAGASYTLLKKLVVSAGVRIDGVPARDLVGGSSGFRRPGYIIAAEPGITYRTRRMNTYLNVPVALERNRIQSVPDKVRSALTKTYYKGDAAFADYVVNLGMSFNIFKPRKYKGSNFYRPGGMGQPRIMGMPGINAPSGIMYYKHYNGSGKGTVRF